MIKRKMSIISIIIIILLTVISLQTISYASEDIKTAMKNVNDFNDIDESDKIKYVANTVIGLLQIAGTGIALIVVTMLGIKYILASPSEKADVKKQIAPILIGCILLFGAVNLMSAVYEFSQNVLKN